MKIYKQIEVAELPYTHEEIAKKWNEYLHVEEQEIQGSEKNFVRHHLFRHFH